MFGIKSTKQFKAAQNALVAKYTFNQLDEATKTLILQEAIRFLEANGYPHELARNMASKEDSTRYLLYSHAMLRLGIQPALQGILYKDKWNPVTENRLGDLIGAEKAINRVRAIIKEKHNINIDIDLTLSA